jgi:hypothetical protein
MSENKKVWLFTWAIVLALSGVTRGATPAGGSSGTSPSSSNSSPAGKPFSFQRQDGIDWLVKPNGEQFFSLGVCVANLGTVREEFNPDNPGYSASRHYADSNHWAEATLKRLKSWGFTTIGGWSDFQTLRHNREAKVAFTPVLHIGATAGAPWWDMWDPKIVGRMEQVARDQILPLRDDPRVIGYYSDNEIGWWNAILFQRTLEQPPTSGQRRRLMELLRQTYRSEWSELLKAFDPAPAVESWQELEQHGTLFLRPGGNGINIVRRFAGILAERYYSLVHDIIRKHDPRALILGDRHPSMFYPEVARASAPYLDAVSSNLNPGWNDGTSARFYLETLHALTGKPILISEFYMAANENRSGNRNNHGVYPVVITQKERAAGFRNTLHGLLGIPYIVGADWFQYYDEPMHGRYDGENFNFGLVDIHDRPYEALTASASALNLVSLKSQPTRLRPDASQGVPPAPRDPFQDFKPMLALKHWDRECGFVKPVSEFPLADLYVCWNKKAIYLGLYAQDVVEDIFYRDKIVRASDRAEWIVSGDSNKTVRARIGAGMEPIANDPTVRLANISGLSGEVRNIACMELPASLFGKSRFRAGDKIDLTSSFFTHCRAYRVEWRGEFELRNQ